MIQLVVYTEYFSLHKVDWCHDYIWLLITGINTIGKLVAVVVKEEKHNFKGEEYNDLKLICGRF